VHQRVTTFAHRTSKKVVSTSYSLNVHKAKTTVHIEYCPCKESVQKVFRKKVGTLKSILVGSQVPSFARVQKRESANRFHEKNQTYQQMRLNTCKTSSFYSDEVLLRVVQDNRHLKMCQRWLKYYITEQTV